MDVVSNVIQIYLLPYHVSLWTLPSLEAQFLLKPLGDTVTGLSSNSKGHGIQCKDQCVCLPFKPDSLALTFSVDILFRVKHADVHLSLSRGRRIS